MPLIVYLSLPMRWDIMVSPFGAGRRLSAPLFIIAVIFTGDAIAANRH